MLFNSKDTLEKIDPEDRPSCQSNPEMIRHTFRPGIVEYGDRGKKKKDR